MIRSGHLVLAVLVLVAVFMIFVLPDVDLDPTTLQALSLAQMLLCVLALAAATVAAHLRLSRRYFVTMRWADAVARTAPDLLDLNCTRLC